MINDGTQESINRLIRLSVLEISKIDTRPSTLDFDDDDDMMMMTIICRLSLL